jgi:hypothetical protein
MTHETLPDEVIRLWPEGAPFKLEGVGPEVEFRGPCGAAGVEEAVEKRLRRSKDRDDGAREARYGHTSSYFRAIGDTCRARTEALSDRGFVLRGCRIAFEAIVDLPRQRADASAAALEVCIL